MVGSIISDYSYVLKQTFSSKLYFTLYLLVLALRILIPLSLWGRYQCYYVCGKRNKLNEEELKIADKYQSEKGKKLA